MSPRKAAAVIAGIVLIVGFLLAINPLSVGGAGVGCGSALSPSQTEALREDLDGPFGITSVYRSACDEEVSERRMLAFPILGVAGLALVFLWLTRAEKASASEDEPAEDASAS